MKNAKNKMYSLITALPATFMSGVSMTYIMMAKEGFRISAAIAYPIGLILAALFFIIYLVKLRKA
jgi:uncharacterized membrane protein YciS (DUF1049 family)